MRKNQKTVLLSFTRDELEHIDQAVAFTNEQAEKQGFKPVTRREYLRNAACRYPTLILDSIRTRKVMDYLNKEANLANGAALALAKRIAVEQGTPIMPQTSEEDRYRLLGEAYAEAGKEATEADMMWLSDDDLTKMKEAFHSRDLETEQAKAASNIIDFRERMGAKTG